jgi:hypothetical protein
MREFVTALFLATLATVFLFAMRGPVADLSQASFGQAAAALTVSR